MADNFIKNIMKATGADKLDIKEISPSVLAYVGDAVYEMYIRTYMVSHGGNNPHKLHRKSVGFVKAKAQSEILLAIYEELSEEEMDIARRGRNAKSGKIPKNADVSDYRHATGFEALIGYLYLTGKTTRLEDILKMCITVK